MEQFNRSKISIHQKDILKGQKIIAAMYLITAHMSDTDPLRQALRTTVIEFIEHIIQGTGTSALSHIEMLLGAASMMETISEKNASVVLYEAKLFSQYVHTHVADETIDALFSSSNRGLSQNSGTSQNPEYLRHVNDNKKTHSAIYPSYTSKTNTGVSEKVFKASNNALQSEKDTRKNSILSFINEKKSAVIKDITSLFPDVSEKTIQRELASLIESGRITKRGSKRWSIYMKVGSSV